MYTDDLDDLSPREQHELQQAIIETEIELSDGGSGPWDDDAFLDQVVSDAEAELASLAEAAQVIDLATAHEATRARQQASHPRRASAEDRLTAARRRLEAGTYMPGSPFAGSHSPDDLLIHRQRNLISRAGPVNGLDNCGPSDAHTGHCMNTHHEAQCGSLADAETTEVLRKHAPYEERAQDAAIDSRGVVGHTSDGRAATLAEYIEATTGVRLHGDAAFETGVHRPELASIVRQAVFGDPDSQDAPEPFGARTMATVEQLREQMGAPKLSTGHDRGLERLSAAALHGVRTQPVQRVSWNARDRRDQRPPRYPVQVDGTSEDGSELYGSLNGSLPVYQAGQL